MASYTDTIKRIMSGDYDDAVANAVGSNIFDIGICLGLPLLVYGLTIGTVEVMGVGAAADVQILRIALLVTTGLVLAMFLIGKKMGKGKATALFALYFIWTAFVVMRAMNIEWFNSLIGMG